MTSFGPLQTADEGAAVEAIDLGEKIPIGPAAGSSEKILPEWSDKLAQNILAGLCPKVYINRPRNSVSMTIYFKAQML